MTYKAREEGGCAHFIWRESPWTNTAGVEEILKEKLEEWSDLPSPRDLQFLVDDAKALLYERELVPLYIITVSVREN